MKIVKCKTFSNSKDLEDWQEQNPNLMIKTIIPLVSGLEQEGACAYTLVPDIFVTYIDQQTIEIERALDYTDIDLIKGVIKDFMSARDT